MSTIDRLLILAQEAHQNGDNTLLNQILDEVERIKQAEARRAERIEKKAKGAKEHKN